MLPITGVPETLVKGMKSFREIFCRAEGFEPVCRFITGLILSPNKTLQGIYDAQVWEGEAPSRRAMHEAVFESGAGTRQRLSSITEQKSLRPIEGEVAKCSRSIGRFPITSVAPRFTPLPRVMITWNDGRPCFRQ